MNEDELYQSLTEGERALFVAVTMVMFSVIELGANRASLLERLTTHENILMASQNHKAVAMIGMFKLAVNSTQPR